MKFGDDRKCQPKINTKKNEITSIISISVQQIESLKCNEYLKNRNENTYTKFE